MAARVERLPYTVGRLTGGWYVLIAVLLALVGLGVYAYSRQLVAGELVTGMRDIGTMGGAPWGLYVAFDAYFVGVGSAALAVAVLIRLLNLAVLRPIARIAQVLAVITIILGAFSILADLGQPARGILNFLRYARPQSPFFGTFTLSVAGFFFASLVYLYLDGRRDAALCAQMPGRLQGFYRLWAAGYRDTPAERERHARVTFWLAIAILPLLVVAHSTLGFVFGVQVGRPGWFSALQAPGFVILAGVSGIGLLIVMAAIVRWMLRAQNRLTPEVFRWLGNFLMVLTIVYLYFVAVELLTITYAAPRHEVQVSTALLRGEYAWLYWGSVAFMVIPALLLFGQFILRRYSLSLMVLSGVLVNLAAIGKRYLVVVPSQTHGTLLPYGAGSYSPTWVEYSVILGLFALGTLLFVLFVKVFPMLEVPKGEEVG
jgi:molybdopterin-containing oxidoreductase family membrane subunit